MNKNIIWNEKAAISNQLSSQILQSDNQADKTGMPFFQCSFYSLILFIYFYYRKSI